MKSITKSLLIGALLVLPACGGGGSITNGNAWVPPQTSVNVATIGKLTFAVGTATLQDGSTGLNTVAFFRQANGDSATLANVPSIAGPSGFAVPSGSPEATGATINQTFSISNGGLFASGFAGFNTNTVINQYYPGGPNAGVYAEPFWGSTRTTLLIGPPITSLFTNADYPSGFAGYLPGFMAFDLTGTGVGTTPGALATGTYTLTVSVPTTSKTATYTATAALGSLVPALAAVAAPTSTEDGTGGTTINYTAPAGTVESVAFVNDTTNGAYYAAENTAGAGAQSVVIPDSDGPCSPGGPGCNKASFSSGDAYTVTVVAFDYNAVESTQPQSSSQSPSLGLGASGQADVSISPALSVASY